jgi:transposase-like protein
MSKRKYSTEEIVRKLREAEVELARGATVKEASKKIGVNEQTFYRWRRARAAFRLTRPGA